MLTPDENILEGEAPATLRTPMKREENEVVMPVKAWISEDSWTKIDRRKEIKQSINSTRSTRLKEKEIEDYRAHNRGKACCA